MNRPKRVFPRLFWFFTAIFIIEATGTVYELVTEANLVLPIYHLGYLVVVWQDYWKATLLATGGSFFFMWKAYEDAN